MPVVWPSAMPWGGRPTAASRPAIPRQDLAGAPRHPVSRHRGGIGSPPGPVVTGSTPSTRSRPASTRRSCPVDGCAAAHVPASAPLGGSRGAHHPPSALRSGPIGLHHGRRAPRPLAAARSARGQPRDRLVTGQRRPAQGPPAPHPATPAQFPPAHLRARTPLSLIRTTDFGFWIGF